LKVHTPFSDFGKIVKMNAMGDVLVISGNQTDSFVVYRWSKETLSWIHVTQLSRPESEAIPGSFTNIQSTISVAGDWPSVRVGLSYYRWVDTFDVNINGTFVAHTRFATTADLQRHPPIVFSDDGAKLFVGDSVFSPSGRVVTYQLDNISWIIKEQVVGEAGEKLGDGIAVSSDGSILIATARSGGIGARGVAAVVKFTAFGRTTITGRLANGDSTDFGVMEVLVSGDGQRIVVVSENENGKYMRVVDTYENRWMTNIR
jgi:hypothetical protein